MSRNTIARIDLAALRHNLAVVRRMAPSSQIAAVVKADAYGHGIGTLTRALDGADLLAVATVGEVRAVRRNGWRGRLLLLEGFLGPGELAEVRTQDAEFVIHHVSQLELLAARSERLMHPVWIKIDTGMHRLGFTTGDLPAVLDELQRLGLARPPVFMTHFACADEPGNSMTSEQAKLFRDVTRGLPGARSLANSAAVLNFSETCEDIIRPGIMLYGISPNAGETGAAHGLRPVMTLSCRLLAINQCRRGDYVGYGARFRCPEDMRVGVAGIGYGDGYPRAIPDGTPVLINGRRAAVAGKVSMDLITIDLRGHDDANVGDEVRLWGEGLAVEEVATHSRVIPYELICGVTGRVRRKIV